MSLPSTCGRAAAAWIVIQSPVLEVGCFKVRPRPAFPNQVECCGGSTISPSLFLQPIPGSDTAVFLAPRRQLWKAGKQSSSTSSRPTPRLARPLVEALKSTSPGRRSPAAEASAREELEETAAVKSAGPKGVVFARWGADGQSPTSQRHGQCACHRHTALLSGNGRVRGRARMPGFRGHSKTCRASASMA